MKLLPLLGSSYTGSMAGITASHNAGGGYLRARAIPVNPSTPAQNQLRTATATATQRWSTVLTDLQRAGWNTYAANTSWTDALGKQIKLSGVNMYVRSNVLGPYRVAHLGSGTFTYFDDPPNFAGLALTPEFSALEVTITTGPPVSVSLSGTLDNATQMTAGFVYVFLGSPQSPGINFFEGPNILCTTVSPDVSQSVTYDLATPPYSDRFGPVAVGQKIWMFSSYQDEEGRVSSKAKDGPLIATQATP